MPHKIRKACFSVSSNNIQHTGIGGNDKKKGLRNRIFTGVKLLDEMRRFLQEEEEEEKENSGENFDPEPK